MPAIPSIDARARNILALIAQVLLAPLGYDKSLQRYRQTAVIESGTVTTVTGLTNIDGRNGAMLMLAQNHTAWAMNVRARIT